MSKIVELSCGCHSVKGELKIVPGDYFHVVCLCCDCQNYASYLKSKAKVLDSHGGTELYQTYPEYIKITEGVEHIQCIQLKEKGLLRWYASCCNMPISNTMSSSNIPFVGVPVNFMQFASEEEKREVLGPITMKAFGKYAKGEIPDDVHAKFPLSYMPKIIVFMIKGLFRKRNKPSPFFHEGKTITTPKVLS